MKTITSRTDIGFPEERKDWAKASAVYDDNATLRIAGHPVMEDWELGYMQRLAEIASTNCGRVLEVGYGLGLSARAIQALGIKEHYVIECHPDVIKKCATDMRGPLGDSTMHLLTGFWEDVTPLLKDGTFDGILFDTYPLSAEEIHANHFWFFQEAHRLLKPGGILTYYSDEVSDFSEKHMAKLIEAGFKKENIRGEVVSVQPPADCEYWQDNTILAPIIKKYPAV
jgi:guanidinoacetate N-methyltransferase